MHRLIFDEDHEMFRDATRRFMQAEAEPHVEKWREQGQCDKEVFLKAGEQGLLGMWVPEEYGGAGIGDFRFEQIVIEETVRHGDLGLFLTLHSRLVGPYIGELGSETLKKRLLPKVVSGETILGIAMTEPGAGSDVAGIKSRAVRDGDDWVINGSKTYISNGINGGAFVVAARTVPDKRHGIGLFVVEDGMQGFQRGRNLAKMGLKTQDTAELFFEDVRVPPENVLGDPEKGFYGLMHFLAEERLISACQEIAHAQVAFDLTMEYILDRKAFGKPIGAFQNSRFKMAAMRTEIDVTQTFVDQCVLLHNEGKLSAELAAEAKLKASEVESFVMDECVQLHGGAGYMSEYRISHMFTDARVSRIYAGSSEIMKEIIARGIGLDERKLSG
ncbi:MAG: acyl-CoA dehydrogenase [Xanthomonadales bacterium]|nr:acyl-CoA dehydrogenase family protein [Gammaproteobacteria bacterium]MBT8051353.1 acyl-CoA dehydrogenase family protein [Gammaproteobacteria bacterium]MBT8057166.1 acyl-CoA dehydrogenase family protein [Gammaproteobacteria bacterium]NNJ80357.1 acyl-CoA dehydrogenase [Xanthomonadales bacterium]NNL04019.1 acyl-CoA dehydrogenase [Xanthomonadales bacterium]